MLTNRRDAVVRGVIAHCEDSVNATTAANTTVCEATLACILNNIDAHTAARWSAGASILAFVPTITALMSNSIDDILLVAEESTVLAVLLAMCSSTLFASRFGNEGHAVEQQTADGVGEMLEFRVRQAFTNASSPSLRRSRRRWALAGCAALLLAFAAGVWYAVSVIMTQGVVVYSCPWRIHVPIWISATQATALANIASLRLQYRHAEPIDLHSAATGTPQKSSSAKPAATTAQQPWPRYMILRHKRTTSLAKSVRGMTNVLTFSLLAFATTVLGGMTMFTASEAVWCMALLAAAAGVSRIISRWMIDGFGAQRQSVVFDVQERHIEGLRMRVDQVVRGIRGSVV